MSTIAGRGPRTSAISLLGWFLLGVIVSVGYIVISGLLAIQIIGGQSGAQFDLSNRIVAVSQPTIPILRYCALAALGVLVISVVSPALSAGGERGPRRELAIGFFLGAASLTVLAFTLSDPATGLGGVMDVGVLPGIEGWIQKGGRIASTHVVVAYIGFRVAHSYVRVIR